MIILTYTLKGIKPAIWNTVKLKAQVSRVEKNELHVTINYHLKKHASSFTLKNQKVLRLSTWLVSLIKHYSSSNSRSRANMVNICTLLSFISNCTICLFILKLRELYHRNILFEKASSKQSQFVHINNHNNCRSSHPSYPTITKVHKG